MRRRLAIAGLLATTLTLVGIACPGTPAPGPAGPGAAPTNPPAVITPGGAGPTPNGAVQGPAIPHTLEGRSACTGCHTVGGPGVGVPGGAGMPADHQGRTDATCLGCHKPSQ